MAIRLLLRDIHYHSSGLAFDIYPLDAKGKAITNSKNPAWDKIYDVMEKKYGLYSMMRDPKQHWDAPHIELFAKTSDMVSWPKGSDGWKNIPESALPKEMVRINAEALNASQGGTYIIPAKKPEASARQK